jgi:C1A family cysteine protease
VELATVEAAIKAKGLDWRAEVTPISEMAASPGRFGLRPNSLRAPQLQAATLMPSAFRPAAPVRVNWQEQRRVSPVRSQGTCGACVAFAICAAMESALAISENTEPVLDLAEADLFFCGCGDCCDSGWDFVPALERASTGVGLEVDLPYGDHVQCSPIQPALRIANWQTTLSDVDRRYVVSRGPVIAGMRVFDDFRYYKSGIYKYAAGDEIGLHAVSVIGYDDNASCWIVKNSWSDDWGENGLFRIAYGECGLDNEFPFISLEVARI